MFISIELSEHLLNNKRICLVFVPGSWERASKRLDMPTSNSEVSLLFMLSPWDHT